MAICIILLVFGALCLTLFLIEKIRGYSLREAIRYSSITSAISVTRIGSRFSIPELREVMDYDTII